MDTVWSNHLMFPPNERRGTEVGFILLYSAEGWMIASASRQHTGAHTGFTTVGRTRDRGLDILLQFTVFLGMSATE